MDGWGQILSWDDEEEIGAMGTHFGILVASFLHIQLADG
jgi:hypothetical protein